MNYQSPALLGFIKTTNKRYSWTGKYRNLNIGQEFAGEQGR